MQKKRSKPLVSEVTYHRVRNLKVEKTALPKGATMVVLTFTSGETTHQIVLGSQVKNAFEKLG